MKQIKKIKTPEFNIHVFETDSLKMIQMIGIHLADPTTDQIDQAVEHCISNELINIIIYRRGA